MRPEPTRYRVGVLTSWVRNYRNEQLDSNCITTKKWAATGIQRNEGQRFLNPGSLTQDRTTVFSSNFEPIS
jgi:hypothetical protein